MWYTELVPLVLEFECDVALNLYCSLWSSYVQNNNTGMFSYIEGNTIGNRWIVVGEYFAFSQLFMAFFGLPITLPTVLLFVDKLVTKLRLCFIKVVELLYTVKQQRISSLIAFYLFLVV